MFAAIRRASSLLSNLAAERRPGAPLYHRFNSVRQIRSSDCLGRSAISAIARVNSVSLQCEVVAYRLAACVEVARDYRRFVVSREES